MTTETGVQIFVGPPGDLIIGDVKTGPAAAKLTRVSDTTQKLDLTIPDYNATEFDFTKSAPAYYTNLNLPDSTVLQSFTINESTNEIFTTQVANGHPTPGQGFRLGRLTIDGVLLDSMVLLYGGHGTTIGLEQVGADTYIWSNYDVIDANGNNIGADLVRFKYTPGLTLNPASPELVRYSKFGPDYVTPTIDQKNGTICFRRASGSQFLELRRLADVKAGVDKVLGKVTIPDDVAYMQGCCIDGDYAYWYSGDTNAVTVPTTITRYKFSTGDQDRKLFTEFGLSIDGVTYEDNFREPECVSLYTDPETGLKTLFAGVVTGEAGRRISKVYGFHQPGAEAKFVGYKTQAAQGYKVSRNNGYVKRLPIGLTNLATLTAPGVYYATGAEMTALADTPISGTGCFIDNSFREISGSIRQTIETNVQTATSERIERRNVKLDGTAGPWRTLHIGQRLTMPAGTTTLASLPPGRWYVSQAESALLTDHPAPNTAGWHVDKSVPNSAGNSIITLWRETSVTANVRIYTKVGAAGWLLTGAGSKDWVSIPLDANAAVGWSTPQCALVENGTFVALQGSFVLAATYASGMTIGTLPAGYWPSATRRIGIAVDDGAGGRSQIGITSDGVIKLYGTVAATKKALLDGLRFGI